MKGNILLQKNSQMSVCLVYNCMMLTEEIRYDFPLSDSEYTHRVYWNDIMHRIWNWLKVIERPLGWS